MYNFSNDTKFLICNYNPNSNQRQFLNAIIISNNEKDGYVVYSDIRRLTLQYIAYITGDSHLLVDDKEISINEYWKLIYNLYFVELVVNGEVLITLRLYEKPAEERRSTSSSYYPIITPPFNYRWNFPI